MDGDFVVCIRGELGYVILLIQIVTVELALKMKLQDYNTIVSKLVNGGSVWEYTIIDMKLP